MNLDCYIIFVIKYSLMVSFSVSALLTLVPSALALSHGVPPNPIKNQTTSATTASHEVPVVPTPKTTEPASAPWQFQLLSQNFVPALASLRKSGVSEEEASSVAKHLIDDALEPAQYTALLREAFDVFNTYGYNPNAEALYTLATHANSAYEQIHGNLDYWSYVLYVRSAASLYDFDLIGSAVSAVATDSHYSKAYKLDEDYIARVTSSLNANPSGSAALETFKNVANSYRSDFQPNHNQVGIIERIFMNALSSI